ncbi:kielin/chordin-like protein isoform X2 [Mercenaria mercenaria]|uniref:kielin/chordin-like protein isoform X2 n=1 Tax=Mercenaria mercenaria TaxID=6596 RepID=UPI00234F7B31|nr:kielin/chordin-like protein isoform X2 [Mercenaria mercenaria]
MELSFYFSCLCIFVSVIYGQPADVLPAKCAGIQCSPPNCADTYIPEGECCPTCPGPGRSCMYLGRRYRDEESFKQECNTCTCNDGNVGCTKKKCPGSKRGRCPPPKRIGICVDLCANDKSCPRRQKCCSNGCGHTCQRPIKEGKQCTYKGVTYQDGESFKDECNDCNCENGVTGCTKKACRRQCVHKGSFYQDGESFKDECNTCTCTDGKAACTLMACPGKPGTCPIPIDAGGVGGGICMDSCSTDYNCPSNEKCCSSGCGKTCMQPADAGRPGQCPKPIELGGGVCVDTCTDDYNCSVGEKCCGNGYCKNCMIAIDSGGQCVHKGKTYQDGETFMDECNTCNCNNGVAGCTRMACPGRPGTCPVPMVDSGGICVDTCDSDYNCPAGEKCCSNGCGRTCMKPAYDGGQCVHKGKTYQDGETFMDECNTCNCNSGKAGCTRMACPGTPGRCPKPVGGVVGICVDSCSSDYDCPTGEKCCSNGCGQTCMKPIDGGGQCVHKGKTYQDGETFMDECNTCNCNNGVAGCTRMACPGTPGRCPKPVGGVVGICVDSCSSDYDCPTGEKCCSNGCGQTCMKPIDGGGQCVHKGKTYQDGETFMDECNRCNCNNGVAGCTRMACPGTPGRCPKPVGGVVGICVDSCSSDYDCPTGEKCCSNGCGQTCMKPIDGGGQCVHKGKTYQDGETFMDECNRCNCNNGVAGCTRMACPGTPGRCPKPVGGVVGICVDSCSSDYDCPTGEKCCSNGCGQTCMKPIDGGKPCFHKGQRYEDGVSFKDECNTCNCENGIAACTQMACTGKPGRCPKPIGTGGAMCIASCISDYSCPADEKCCDDGFCQTCMKPIDSGKSCFHNGKEYPDGESFMDDCNTCRCINGNAGCTRMACPGRPGTCPVPMVGSGSVCVDECNSDYECPTGQKCCNNGYCQACMKPAYGGKPCFHKGKRYEDGVNFKDECNTCNCENGIAACTQMACTGKPGRCPKPIGTGGAMCIATCTSDYSCPADEKCCDDGFCQTCMKPIDGGKSCFHNGNEYLDGESFMDDCNTCRCINGNAGCTRMACPKKDCIYNGNTYRDGEKFNDKCNECVCVNGNAKCTYKSCPEEKPGRCPPAMSVGSCVHICTTDWSCSGRQKCCSNGCGTLCMPPTNGGRSCYSNGRTYSDGETFKDDCNTCTCTDGKAACTLMACPGKPCMYNGRRYRDGEQFKQDCNTCTCSDGQAACTQMACYDERPGQCPAPVGTGYCIHRCTTDLSCERGKKCCSNGCGTECMLPVIGGGCIHNGVKYRDGETFKDDCNTCKCSGGKAACTLMACPKDKPGTCPAPIGDLSNCVDECSDDFSCTGVQKCCSNGCARVCTMPESSGKPCFANNGTRYEHGETFKDECNTCTCRNGNAACTLMACPNRPCYHEGRFLPHGDSFKDECNTCVCTNGRLACTYMTCGKSCVHNGKTYEDGKGFKDSCNTCLCRNGTVSCTLLDCSGAKPGTCPRRQLFQPCNNRCYNDRGCQGNKKCCSNWCGYTCMNPVGGDNCASVTCPTIECTEPNKPHTLPGYCCPVCRPPIGTKPGSCPRRPSGWLCKDLCRSDFNCPGQQKCCSHRCGKSCERPRFDRCADISCPPLRCMRQFRPPGRCCPVCRRGRGRD